MDIHHRVVGISHIVFGLIEAFQMLIPMIFMGGIGLASSTEASGLIFGLGASVFLMLLILALVQAYTGAAYLQGKPNARIILIAFGVLSLYDVPAGTALGLYTLWVLLIQRPDQPGKA